MTEADANHKGKEAMARTVTEVKDVPTSPDLDFRISKARHDLDLFLKNWELIKVNYPEILENLKREKSDYYDVLVSVENLATIVNDESRSITNAEIVRFIDAYNATASQLQAVKRYFHIGDEKAADQIAEAIKQDTAKIVDTLSADEKLEIQNYARTVYEELFPETYTAKTVKYLTGKDEISDYGKLKLARFEGIELAVTSLLNLLNPQTYGDFVKGVQTMYGMSLEEWALTVTTIKEVYNVMTPVEKVAGSITFLASICACFGGAGALTKLANNAKMPASVSTILHGTADASRIMYLGGKTQMLPIAVIEGLRLENI